MSYQKAQPENYWEKCEALTIAARSGIGTVQYLLGVAAMELGSRAEAEAALKAAAASESLLTEEGPPVRELRRGGLAQLVKPRAN